MKQIFKWNKVQLNKVAINKNFCNKTSFIDIEIKIAYKSYLFLL